MSLLFTFVAACCVLAPVSSAASRPNFIVFMVDDVGYGDFGCFGGTRAPTPNLDTMAKEGMKFTDFYVHPVCGVTRAAFMTGSYAMRIGEPGNRKGGHPVMHPQEITIAEVLRDAGYTTGMIGKWHLCGGRRASYPPELMPNAQGFDYFFGAPLHNGFTRGIEDSKFRMQLMRQNEIIDDSIDQSEMDEITRRYTDEAVTFIKKNGKDDKPFFLFVAHSMAHVVLGATETFRGKTGGGLYGDTIAELDLSAGRIVSALKSSGIDDNTLMVVTSDNGPWIEKHLKGKGGNDTHYGTADPLRGSKMMTWEGGVRVPTIVRWPGRVPADKVNREPATIMDLLPTFAELADAKLPTDRKLDGKNIEPLLTGSEAISPHEAIYYYSYVHLQAVRSGKWKLVRPRPAKPRWTLWSARMTDAVPELSLYDLHADIGETTNVAAAHPEVVTRLIQLIETGRSDIGDYDMIGSGARFFDDGPRRGESKAWLHRSVEPGQQKPVEASTLDAGYDNFKPLGNLRYDFETGDLQGWKVVDGKLGSIISNETSLPNHKQRPYNRQGKYHLSTIAGKNGPSDNMTGTIESPRFVLKSDKISFLVSGGNRDDVHVAIFDVDGKELLRTGGGNSPQMLRRTLDVSKHRGKTVFLRIVDRAVRNWGHINFDGFSAEGTLQ